MREIIFIFFYGLLYSPLLYSSTPEQKVDSLNAILKSNIADSSKLTVYSSLFDYYIDVDPEKAQKIINEVLNLGKIKKNSTAIGDAYSMTGTYKKNQGEIDSAIFYIKKAENIFRQENNLKRLGYCLMNLGNNLKRKGELKQAKESFAEAITIARKLNDKDLLASNLVNLGLAEHSLGNLNAVFNHYFEALRIFETLKNDKKYTITCVNIANLFSDQKRYDASNNYLSYGIEKARNNPRLLVAIYGNMANNFSQLNNYNKAIEHYKLALNQAEKNSNFNSIALCNSNLGLLYSKIKQFDKAIHHIRLAEKQFLLEDSKTDLAEVYRNYGTIYKEQKKFNDAIFNFKKAINLSEQYNFPNIKQYSLIESAKSYYQLNDYKNAYLFAEQFINLNDSINNANNTKEMLDVQTKYETEKKELEIKNLQSEKKIKNIELEKSMLEAKKQNQQKIFFAIGFVLVIVLTLFTLKNLKEKQKTNKIITQQKLEVERQKDIVEEQHKEITDSINYAKRIQTAILPPYRLFKEFLPDSFIIYQPKDIVSGDFYWLQNFNKKIMFAVADCTGHGVPGAMVSVICNNSLNRSVKEFSLTDSGKILDKTNEIVVSEFEKSDEEVKDGMDISLCVFDYETNTLNWSGANNPLWIIRNNELIEYKANKQPIGKYMASTPFVSHSIDLKKGDSLYIFSDGYIDQFGGDSGKKFKSSKLKELLLSVQNKSMTEQKNTLEKTIKEWRGSLTQVDDICLVGVKF